MEDSFRTHPASATRRIVVILLAAGSFSVDRLMAENDRWTVSFHAAGHGVGSAAVALQGPKGPLLVTVALQGGDISRSTVQLGAQQIPATVLGHDAVSRLCFFRPLGGEAVKSANWGSSAGVERGSVLTATSGEIEEFGKMLGWVNRIGDKILPLALMKVGFRGTIPAPGTPLVDHTGKVVAMAFQKSATEPSVYAIPADAVQRVAKDIAVKGRLVRGWLGLSLRVENESPKIVRVLPGSPAGVVGMQVDDLISKIGGRLITNYADVVNAFFYLVPGEAVDIEVNRAGSVLAFTLIPAAEKPGN